MTDAARELGEAQELARALTGTGVPLQRMTAASADEAVSQMAALSPAREISRDAVERRALAHASRQAGELVTNVTQETRFAVRELATQAIQEGRDVYQAARSLRAVVGLNARQAAGFDKFIAEQMESDRSAAGIQQAIDREYARLVNYRADVMARTELWQAGQEGQREAWREAAAEGALDIRGVDALFRSDDGETSEGPLLHVRCDCSQRLRAVTVNGVRFYVREWVVSPRNPCERCLAFKGARAMP